MPGLDAVEGSAAPVRMLGRFQPTEFEITTIEQEWRAVVMPQLPACCQEGRLSVRVPQGQPDEPGNLAWHRDQDVRHLTVWASEQPTEIRLPSGDTVQPMPCRVTWLDNQIVDHRQPADTDRLSRWFVSVRCPIDQQEQE